jgi:DNA repair protein RecO (recombination protein O)
MTVHTPAIVLKSFPYGETSIISKCFTKEKGKVSFIIRGARNKKASKFSHFQPLSYVDIIYNHKSKNELQTVLKVSFREFWSNIIKDLRSITLAVTILDMTEKALSPDEPLPVLFNNLKDVLRFFNKNNTDPNLLFWFYECALLTNLGFQPNLEKIRLPGLSICNPNEGPNSGSILATLLGGNIFELPKDPVTKKDRNVISDYLWTLLCYHCEGMKKIKSIATAKKILSR